MSKDNKRCQTCANQVNGIHCTMHKEMSAKSKVYKKCDGYKKYVPPPKKKQTLKKEEETNYEELGTFGRFIKKGGGYSCRTGEFVGVSKVILGGKK